MDEKSKQIEPLTPAQVSVSLQQLKKQQVFKKQQSFPKTEAQLKFKFTQTNKYSQYLVCKICSLLMLDPIRLFPCGHTFCKQCIEGYNKKINKKRCFVPFPECGKYFIELQADLMAIKLIDDLQVQCKNDGCPWSGSLQRYKRNHESQCKFKNGFSAWISNIKQNIQIIAKQSELRRAEGLLDLSSDRQVVDLQTRQVIQLQQNVLGLSHYKVGDKREKRGQAIDLDGQISQPGKQQKLTKRLFINSYKNKFHKIIENPANMNLTRPCPKN